MFYIYEVDTLLFKFLYQRVFFCDCFVSDRPARTQQSCVSVLVVWRIQESQEAVTINTYQQGYDSLVLGLNQITNDLVVKILHWFPLEVK